MTLFRQSLIVLVTSLLGGCCPDGTFPPITGYSTSPLKRSLLNVPADFDHYYCVGSDNALVECSWRGDKNLPSGVDCPKEKAPRDFNSLGVLAKVRIIRGCGYDQGKNLEAAFIDATSGTIISWVDHNSDDTGVIAPEGGICFRSSTGLDATVEEYTAILECGGKPSTEATGGIERTCTPVTCHDGAVCGFPGTCTKCEYAERCLFPGESCISPLPCGTGSCDITAACVTCGTFNPYQLCLAPGQYCP